MTLKDSLTEYRDRIQMEQDEAIARRRRKISEQSAVTNSPGERVRIWERLHALSLPGEAAHPLVKVIAHDTGLTLEQVLSEQRQRSDAAATGKLAGGSREVWDPYCTRPDRIRRP